MATEDRIESLEAENEQLRDRLESLEQRIEEVPHIDEETDGEGSVGNLSRRGTLAGLAGLGGLGLGATGSASAASGDHLGESWSGSVGTGLEIAETSASGFTYGVRGLTSSPDGRGVFGRATSSTGNAIGLYGITDSSNGKALFGNATASSGKTEGLQGRSQSYQGVGVLGDTTSSSGQTVGVKGESFSYDGAGVYGEAKSSTGTTYGVRGDVSSSDGYGLYTPDDAKVDGNLEVTGTKNFVQAVETTTGSQEVVYTAVEAGTARTEASGVAEMDDGSATIDLPKHFGMVTSEDKPLTVQITAYADRQVHPQVVEQSTDHIVVEDFGDEHGEYSFGYTVKGVREGFEDRDPVRDI